MGWNTTETKAELSGGGGGEVGHPYPQTLAIDPSTARCYIR